MMHDGTISEITGTETRAKDGGPLDALIEFYRAFNAGDLDALAANWADGDAPSMDNPIGGIRRGWAAIGTSSLAARRACARRRLRAWRFAYGRHAYSSRRPPSGVSFIIMARSRSRRFLPTTSVQSSEHRSTSR